MNTAKADVVLLQRRLLPWWQLALLRSHAKVLVYDVDDAVFLRDSNSAKEPLSRFRLAKFWTTLKMADALIVGNRYLECEAASHIPREKIYRVPTCLELKKYQPTHHHRTGADARLVWIGSASTLPSLELITPGLQEVSRRLPGMGLHVICDQFPTMPGVNVVPRTWTQATETQDLAQADIGVCWLPDHPWSLGKCGLKFCNIWLLDFPSWQIRLGCIATWYETV